MELKPCPFCGGEATVMIRPFIGADGHGFVVECDRCWGLTGYYETEAAAVEAWNTRAERTCERSRYAELFGTPERVARMLHHNGSQICCECLIRDECAKTPEDSKCMILHYDELLEWLRGDA